jgi:5-methylcytosine-specific restriction endonuclease McrA
VTTKICTSCKRELPIENFGICRKLKSGLNIYCKECKRKTSLQYYYEHKEELCAKRVDKDKIYRQTHKEQINARYRKHYAESMQDETWREHQRYMAYKESHTARAKRFKLERSAKRRGLEKIVENTLSENDIKFLYLFQDKKCACCSKEFSDSLPYTLDHIIPLSKGGGLTLENVQLLCRKCNCSKGIKSTMYRKPISYNSFTAIYNVF